MVCPSGLTSSEIQVPLVALHSALRGGLERERLLRGRAGPPAPPGGPWANAGATDRTERTERTVATVAIRISRLMTRDS